MFLDIFFLLFFLTALMLVFILFKKGRATTTYEVTEEQGIKTVGNLQRQMDGLQYFVTDPVDNDKVWLNSNDDMYEDGAGKIWKLV